MHFTFPQYCVPFLWFCAGCMHRRKACNIAWQYELLEYACKVDSFATQRNPQLTIYVKISFDCLHFRRCWILSNGCWLVIIQLKLKHVCLYTYNISWLIFRRELSLPSSFPSSFNDVLNKTKDGIKTECDSDHYLVSSLCTFFLFNLLTISNILTAKVLLGN